MKSGSTSKGVGNGAINTEQSESSDAEASIGQYTKGTPLEECQRSSTIEVIAGATNETIEEHEDQPEISSENVNEDKISIAIRKRNLPEGEIAKDILQPKKKCIEKKIEQYDEQYNSYNESLCTGDNQSSGTKLQDNFNIEYVGSSQEDTNYQSLTNESFGKPIIFPSKTDFIEVNPYCSIPVHSLVLSLNSLYFKNLLAASGMRETFERDITIQVNSGEGKFLKILINAFYDQSVLTSLKTFDLLHVLEVADHFSCEVFIKKCVELLKGATIKSLTECNEMVQHIGKLERRISLLGGKYEDMKECCIRFMTVTFCPLENNQDEHDHFYELSFKALLLFLRSHRPITWNEASLLMFISNWLDYDDSRQKPEIIGTLLLECNYTSISSEFLYDVITPNHALFSIWPDFKTWFLDVVSYHSFSKKRQYLSGFKSALSDRDFRSVVMVPGWIIKFDQMGPCYFASEECASTYRGYQITPRIFFKDCIFSDKLYTVSMQIANTGISDNHTLLHDKLFLSFSMAISLLPGYEEYNNKIFTCNYFQFLREHFRTIEIEFRSRTNYCVFEIGVIEKALVEAVTSFYVPMAFKESHKNWPSFMAEVVPLNENTRLELKKSNIYGQNSYYGYARKRSSTRGRSRGGVIRYRRGFSDDQ